jgi:hypothetical protein
MAGTGLAAAHESQLHVAELLAISQTLTAAIVEDRPEFCQCCLGGYGALRSVRSFVT